jgi:hypothetical protein
MLLSIPAKWGSVWPFASATAQYIRNASLIVGRMQGSAYTLDHARRKLARRMRRGNTKPDADSEDDLRTWIERT